MRFTSRLLFETMFVVAAGLAGAHAVYRGDAENWPGFNPRSGYWGSTEELNHLLYAMPYPSAMACMATIWFCYAVGMAMIVIVVARLRWPDQAAAPPGPKGA